LPSKNDFEKPFMDREDLVEREVVNERTGTICPSVASYAIPQPK
jgi:hypothetical protein